MSFAGCMYLVGTQKLLYWSCGENVMSSNSAAHCGANKKMPIQGVDASGTVTLAADALVSISTL